jgi:hypothetical protein
LSQLNSPFKIFSFSLQENSHRPGPGLKCKDVSEWVTSYLNLSEEDAYSERTMSKWLHILGFNVNIHKKGIYMDGHERADVIVARRKFADAYAFWRAQSVQFDDSSETLEEIPSANAKYLFVSLDQKAHHANDVIKRLI